MFGNQLKSVVGEVLDEPILTESGKEIDGKFGAISVQARIVSSPYQNGTTSILLDVLAKRAVQAYKS